MTSRLPACLAAIVALSLIVGPAQAQSRDPLGGTIGGGRNVPCFLMGARQHCVFYPRNGNGSFALRSASLGSPGVKRQDDVDTYHMTKVGPDRMRVALVTDEGNESFGVYARSKDDSACWVRRNDRICAW